MVVGTTTGKILAYHVKTMKEKTDTYTPHKRAVNDMWIADSKVILSCSNDKSVFLKFFNEAFDDQEVDFGLTKNRIAKGSMAPDELPHCVALGNESVDKLTPQNLLVYIGTTCGRLLSFNKANQLYSYVQTVFDKPE